MKNVTLASLKLAVINEANGRVVRRFHKLKTEWGFAQLLSHETLNDPSNGYLVEDTCAFGVEVSVIKGICKGECLSMINQPQRDYFTWKIDNFADLKDKIYYSEEFTIEGRRWKLRLEPEGEGTGADTFLSLYLMLDDSESLPPNRKLYAKYKLRIRDQINSNHLEKPVEYWFSDPFPNNGSGYGKFLSKRDLHDASKGYLVGDFLFIECKLDVISVFKDFSSN
ncbi:MATH domain and coiled-coil domain-containing protein At3g58210-like [Corylus avellana]|uniref:MATH domain and coiled-coil domain-containing protein At3g58210-like n=1 Tax=Corylus avellana TaxID=13451 RepID=UPI00286BA956|nr:MATH domain and coiled-coil domain-containing protein At3g58210-like [Corylus avellana]